MNCVKGTAYYSERDSSYYNGNAETNSANVAAYQNSPYYPLYLETLKKIKAYGSKHIFEIGCGHGVFSEMLYANGKYCYLGLDFSEKRLEIARKKVSKYKYFCQNIYDTEFFDEYDYDTAICHEVLEHLRNDIHVFKKIKKGTYFIFSVPEHDSYAHVRYFPSVDIVINRYKKYIRINEIKYINRIFLVDGTIY